jgi:hypothetical protein
MLMLLLLFYCHRVPLGFICGYPLPQGELYGGSMFVKSAAGDTLQGQAIQAVNERWGADVLSRSGREHLGIAVCKKKYKPFQFHVVEQTVNKPNGSSSAAGGGSVQVLVERMLGCKCHHAQRRSVVEKFGVRDGWEPFGQWSKKKALELARQATIQLNELKNKTSVSELTDEDDSSESSASTVTAVNLSSLCGNGQCTWKVKSKYDDVYQEMNEQRQSL